MKKKLYRSQTNVMFSGVCGGLAEYFDVDPTLIRLLFVASTFFSGAGILLYLVMWFIVPVAEDELDVEVGTALESEEVV